MKPMTILGSVQMTHENDTDPLFWGNGTAPEPTREGEYQPAVLLVAPKYRDNDLLDDGGVLGLLLRDDFGLVPHYISRSTGATGWGVNEPWEDDPRRARGLKVIGNVTDDPGIIVRELDSRGL